MKYLSNCLHSFFYQGHFTLVNVIALFFSISCLVLILVAIVLFNHGLIQYVNSKWSCKFTSVVQMWDYLLDIIYWRYAPGIVLMAAVMYGIYFTVIVGMIGIELINGINMGGQKWVNIGIGMPWEWELNMVDMAELNIKDMNTKEYASIEGIKENSMYIIKEGGKIIGSIEPRLARVNYFRQDLQHNLIENSYLGGRIKKMENRELEQFLTTIEFGNKSSNKYIVCPIKQLKAGADILLIDTTDFKSYCRVQYKFFSGNLLYKDIMEFVDKYGKTTDLLYITLNGTVTNYDIFFHYWYTAYMEGKIPFSIYIHIYNSDFDAQALANGVKITDVCLDTNSYEILRSFYDIEGEAPIKTHFVDQVIDNLQQLTQSSGKDLQHSKWLVKKHTPLE